MTEDPKGKADYISEFSRPEADEKKSRWDPLSSAEPGAQEKGNASNVIEGRFGKGGGIALEDDLTVGDVLDDAKKADLETLVVLGVNSNGVWASTTADLGLILILFERFKHEMIG